MNKHIQKIVLSVFGLAAVSLQLAQAQSIQYDPGRSPFYNYTVVGFFTAAPPVIDAVIDDYCWTRPTAPGTALSGGAGFDGTNFPANQNIRMPINVDDGGVTTGTVKPNSYTAAGGVYPASAGNFGMAWDLNYVYFAIKIVNQAAADLATATNDRGVELFFNNGNGRSGVTDPIEESYPRKYNNLRDMQVQLWYLPKPGETDYPLLGAVTGLANYGISLPPSAYKFAVKKTSDGYIYEGRIGWTVLNKEFINEADGSYTNDIWRPLKGRTLGLDIGASLFRGSGPAFQMNWNECCFNVNWSRSAYYGYFLLAGDTASAVCPTSFNVTVTNASITGANDKVTVGATSFLPLDAAREINWTLEGTSGTNPLALIDNNTGVITPLNNGILTVTGKSKIKRCATTTVSGTVTVSIGAQVAPASIVITGQDITENWGTSALVASAVPTSAPSDVKWSIDPASNLARIDTATGLLKATSLGSGSVTVKAVSIANGTVGTKVINITTPVVISSCIGVNAYANIYQCNRTLNAVTIAGFKIGAKIQLISQYFDPANPSPSTVPGIPDNLMKYTIQQPVPAASIAAAPNWELTLNQQQGNFSITGVYQNDTTKKIQVKVTLKGTTTLTGCSATSSGANFFSVARFCGGVTTLDGINDNLIEASSFEVYPNPASDAVNVGVTLKSGGSLSVALVNTLGEVVVSSTTTQHAGKAEVKLSTAGLPAGLYIVKAIISGGGTVAKKLLVTH